LSNVFSCEEGDALAQARGAGNAQTNSADAAFTKTLRAVIEIHSHDY
jgi:hypothetical protein